MKHLVLLCAVLSALSCRSATSPGELGEAWPVVETEWAIAQKVLGAFGVTRSDLVKPTMFTWHFHDGPAVRVVRHEAGHERV